MRHNHEGKEYQLFSILAFYTLEHKILYQILKLFKCIPEVYKNTQQFNKNWMQVAINSSVFFNVLLPKLQRANIYLQQSLSKRKGTAWKGHVHHRTCHRDKCDQQPFTFSHIPSVQHNMHVLGLWRETWVPRERKKKTRHKENIHTDRPGDKSATFSLKGYNINHCSITLSLLLYFGLILFFIFLCYTQKMTSMSDLWQL